MPRITINIDCAPHELAGVLSSIRDGFVAEEDYTRPYPPVEPVVFGGINRDPNPYWKNQYADEPSGGENNAEGENLKTFAGVGDTDALVRDRVNAQKGATGDKVARRRRTKAEIEADNAAAEAAKNVTSTVQTATEALSGAPVAGESFHEARDAAADEAQAQPHSLFTLGGSPPPPPPPISPTVSPAAEEASYETLQATVLALTKAKVPFKTINEVIQKHNTAASVASGRELNGLQRGACVAELTALKPA